MQERQPLPQPKPKPQGPSHPTIASLAFRVEVADGQGDDRLLVEFGSTADRTPVWVVVATMGKATFTSLGSQWGHWDFNKDKTCILLSPGWWPFPWRWLPRFTVFVLMGTDPQMSAGGGTSRYMGTPGTDALSDPSYWTVFAGDVGDWISSMESLYPKK